MHRSRSNECVLSLDISLDDLDTTILSPHGDWTPHQAYTNNWPGFQALKKDLIDLPGRS